VAQLGVVFLYDAFQFGSGDLLAAAGGAEACDEYDTKDGFHDQVRFRMLKIGVIGFKKYNPFFATDIRLSTAWRFFVHPTKNNLHGKT
jgi:hypothetical protein